MKKEKYDWTKIWKEYRRLGIPSDVWTPSHIDMDASNHKVIISSRSTGKTTNFILLGMIMNSIYGTVIQYVRHKELSKKKILKLCETIESFGYIEKITKGKYNSVDLYADSWKYCKKDEDGKIVEKSEKEFMHNLFTSLSDEYKSSYNAPMGDFIIIDEFMHDGYQMNEFFHVMDIISTVGREREQVYTFFLGNNLNAYSIYLQEMNIARQVRQMNWGEKKYIDIAQTRFYVELIQKDLSNVVVKKKSEIVWRRFGFGGEKLSSITGVGGWNIKQYQHIPEFLDERKDAFVEQRWICLNGDWLRCKILQNDIYGRYMYIKPSRHKPTNETDIIYQLSEVQTIYQRYGQGFRDDDKIFWSFVNNKNVYLCTNECGMMLDEYMEELRARTNTVSIK